MISFPNIRLLLESLELFFKNFFEFWWTIYALPPLLKMIFIVALIIIIAPFLKWLNRVLDNYIF